jgi:hypothetical protein
MTSSFASAALDEIYNKQFIPFDPGILETMQGSTLAVIANRLDTMKQNQLSFYTYGGIINMIKDCEMLASHPIMGLYTVGIASLSYYEWKKRMR